MKTQSIITILIAVVLSVGITSYMMPTGTGTTQQETAFDRVMESGKIRCAYVEWDPYYFTDHKTGETKGFSYEAMMAIGKELGLEIEWVEEVGWGNFQEGLKTNRYDMMCVPVWQSGQRASAALLSQPMSQNSLMLYVREDDNRFSKPSDVNNSQYKIVVVDGDVTQTVRRLEFPKAQELAMPRMVGPAEVVMNVAQRKADAVVTIQKTADLFNAASETNIKLVSEKPIRVFNNVYAFKHGEHDFKNMIDSTVEGLYRSGVMGAIVDKYDPYFLPVD